MDYPAVPRLVAALRATRHPSPKVCSAIARMWDKERKLCSNLPPYYHREHSGERLRNALLQAVLLMQLFDWPAPLALDRIRILSQGGRERFAERRPGHRLDVPGADLPRAGTYRFLAEKPGQPIGQPMQCEPSDDLRWLSRALSRKEFPTSRSNLEAALVKIAEQFAASGQGARQSPNCEPGWRNCQPRPKNWAADYEAVAPEQNYNPVAEILIEAIGLGTYPLIQAYNRRFADRPIDRSVLRSLYGNRRPRGSADRRREVIGRLTSLLPERIDWPTCTRRSCYGKPTGSSGRSRQ